MNEVIALKRGQLPERLARIASPPKQLFVAGSGWKLLEKRPVVAVVGSRAVSPYGKQVTHQLAFELASQGVIIVSGLALGVDAIAHRAALEAGGVTVAVLPSPIGCIAPATNRRLAAQIIENGGALISEYSDDDSTFKTNFVARNRLVSGLANVLLITEAGEKSGTLHTARFALEQGIDVLAVPGMITARGSVGTNNLIKAGAIVATSYVDVMHALGIAPHTQHAAKVLGRNQLEQCVLDLLLSGEQDGEQLLARSKLTTSEYSQVMTMLEIGGKIRSLGGNQWALT